jgi:GTP cyclohydrolase III
MTTYNGWKNYETWAVKLWLDNEEAGQALQQELLEQAQNDVAQALSNPNDCFPLVFKMDSPYWSKEEAVKFTLTNLLNDYITENNPLAKTFSVYSDLIATAIDKVSFRELAAHIIADAELAHVM